MSDAGYSDDADFSQPPTPNRKEISRETPTPKKNISYDEPTEVPTPQNILPSEPAVVLGPDGNPATPKYAGGKYEGEARLQEYDPTTGEPINKGMEATVAKASRDREEADMVAEVSAENITSEANTVPEENITSEANIATAENITSEANIATAENITLEANIATAENIDKEARTEKEADILSDPDTETTEDKAILVQPESPPFVSRFP